MLRKPRVTTNWNPDRAVVSVERKRDRDVLLRAFSSVAPRAEDVRKVAVQTVFRYRGVHSIDANEPRVFTFDRHDVPTVVGALAVYAQENTDRPLLSHRVTTLVGELVVASGREFVQTLDPKIAAAPDQITV